MLSDPIPVVICYYFHYLPGNWVWLQFLCAVKIWGDIPQRQKDYKPGSQVRRSVPTLLLQHQRDVDASKHASRPDSYSCASSQYSCQHSNVKVKSVNLQILWETICIWPLYRYFPPQILRGGDFDRDAQCHTWWKLDKRARVRHLRNNRPENGPYLHQVANRKSTSGVK